MSSLQLEQLIDNAGTIPHNLEPAIALILNRLKAHRELLESMNRRLAQIESRVMLLEEPHTDMNEYPPYGNANTEHLFDLLDEEELDNEWPSYSSSQDAQ